MNAATHCHFETASPLNERDRRIAHAQSRAIHIMRNNPDRARSITSTLGTVRDGLACEITQGDFSLVTDLGRGMGGDGLGPSPSFYARAAIAGCIAIAVKMHAANSSLEFREVQVQVETDMYDLALWGIGPHSAAPLATEISIRIDTDESQAVVRRVVKSALDRDPWFLALRDKQLVETRITLD